MSPERMNQVIAEFCGIVSHDKHGPLYKTKAGYVRNCPDYYGDLNEIHEALLYLLGTLNGKWDKSDVSFLVERKLELITVTTQPRISVVFCEASQICEALLRATGKWEEST